MKRFLSSALIVLSLLIPYKAFPVVDNAKVFSAYHNEVVIYEKYPTETLENGKQWTPESRGGGTVYYTDDKDTYIVTCLHLRDSEAKQPIEYDVYFVNGEMHQAQVIFTFGQPDGQGIDMMIMKVPNFKWDSYAKIAQIHMGEEVFGFHWQAIEDPITHKYTNFFDRKLTTKVNEGTIDSPPQDEIMGLYQNGLPFRSFYMADMSVETHAGMSGSGIFDKDGNLVGLVNGCCNWVGEASFSPILLEIEHFHLDPFGWAFCPWIPRESK